MKYTTKDGFLYYFNLVEDSDCQSLFSSTSDVKFLERIDEEKANYSYSPDKWNIKQVLGHITDHERIKMYRAFLLSRNQEVELWGYDQNSLIENSRYDVLTYSQIVEDYKNIRMSSISFINTLSEDQLKIKGLAYQAKVTLEDFLKSIIGHEKHHIRIIKERYL